MDLTYFKRYRMEIDLGGRSLAPATLPSGYRLLPWQETLLDAFAQAKFLSFRNEIDATVFPCLGELAGCRRLMLEITRKPGFIPAATWLLEHRSEGPSAVEYCGTVQGVRDRSGMGAIQNLGVAPERRNSGLGTHLLMQALAGFQAAGLTQVHLEVTATNVGAIRLYERVGFIIVKTVFKSADIVYSR